MKAFFKTIMIATIIFGMVSCEDDNKRSSDNITTQIKDGNGFDYKVFYQKEESELTRRGIIILAVGDGGKNDRLLNDQCYALATMGFVAVTTTYRADSGSGYYASFKEDMELVIANETAAFGIAKDRVVLGGTSGGGNRLHGAVLPPNPEYNSYPIEGIRGVILECAGGDYWKGRGILYPVLFMNNKVDDEVQTIDADKFLEGLQDNVNPGVKEKSRCLIIPVSGHCTDSEKYKEFITDHIDEWF